jgi:hypothetical protein
MDFKNFKKTALTENQRDFLGDGIDLWEKEIGISDTKEATKWLALHGEKLVLFETISEYIVEDNEWRIVNSLACELTPICAEAVAINSRHQDQVNEYVRLAILEIVLQKLVKSANKIKRYTRVKSTLNAVYDLREVIAEVASDLPNREVDFAYNVVDAFKNRLTDES